MSQRRYAVALTIAGSDSGGGAGIQADLKTFHQFGVFGTSAITAITAQNTLGVRAWDSVRPELVAAQIDAVAEDLEPIAFKSGMLGSAAVASAVADGIVRHELRNYVMDPVMVATSGDRLIDDDALAVIKSRLIPLAALVTPNLHEVQILTGKRPENQMQMRKAGLNLLEMGAGAALIKGGHLEGDMLVDLFISAERADVYRHLRVDTRSSHGTGCTLSAAITAGLALGRPMTTAVTDAVSFVQRAIASAPELGKGNGPLDHFVGAP